MRKGYIGHTIGAGLLMLVFISGCGYWLAANDHHIELTYENVLTLDSGADVVHVAKPVIAPALPAYLQGTRLGYVKNGKNVKMGVVYTNNDVGDWIVGAIIQELRPAGYTVKPVATLPGEVAAGMKIVVTQFFIGDPVNYQTNFLKITAHMDAEVEIWQSGRMTQKIEIQSRGVAKYALTGSPVQAEGLSVRRALQQTIQQMIPHYLEAAADAG